MRGGRVDLGCFQRADGLGGEDLVAVCISVRFFQRGFLYGGMAAGKSTQLGVAPALSVRTYGDPAYETAALAVLTLIGLLLMRDARKYVVAE